MAKLSADGKYVTVEKGDNLWRIAVNFLGNGNESYGPKYTWLAQINGIPNPSLIYTGQKIYLSENGSSSKTSSSSSSNVITVNQFGLLSTSDNTLFATWTWDRSNTASYKVLWTYSTGSGVWFEGSLKTINIDEDAPDMAKQDTYNIPANAKQVKFKVKPIAKNKKDSKGQETDTPHWNVGWSSVKTYTDNTPLDTPSVPKVEIDKYMLTATLDSIDIDGATGIEFQVVKNNASTASYSKSVNIVSTHASHTFKIEAGAEYKVRCRAYNEDKEYSEWSTYSDNEGTIPDVPSGITNIRATSETSVYLSWSTSTTATSYDIEYATKKEYFDSSDQTTTKTGIEPNQYEISGLESGTEYFFRVRAANEKGSSGWSGMKSVVIGKAPAAPTTWSSTTTVITGEPLILYWVHNSEDGSSQTYADLELYINGVKETHTINNTNVEEENDKDKTSFWSIDTSSYVEGTKIQWRVRTAGINKVYGVWSIERTIDIYAPTTLELSMTNQSGDPISTLTSFPFYIKGLAGPKTQIPVGYHLTVTANEIYETVDSIGNEITVNVGEHVYSKYFDTNNALLVEMTAGNINLENNINYTVSCTVSMNSGLTADASLEFTVSWTDVGYEPNAVIGVDENTFSAYIQPYCENREIFCYKVDKSGDDYVPTAEALEWIYGSRVTDALTTTGEPVYSGTASDGNDVYYHHVEIVTPVEDITLSVYRREFDGSFTELATGLDAAKRTAITDPHPALDFARYRIVATSKTTGAVSYYDPPGYPIGGKAVIIQWNEDWTSFETSETEIVERPPWAGSLLRLPYNIDVSDNHNPDVELIEYVGRAHPISYYGTQLGQTATWNIAIEKDDEETLYALRRLARWMGDVYVREPSGSGYWANVTVSFSQKHRNLTIPVTLDITRVEGGI